MSNQQARHETVLDDATRQIAHIYAEALLNAADKRGQAGDILGELKVLVGEVLARDPRVETFLGSPAVARERKGEVLRQAFAGRASDLLLQFLMVLNEHDRLSILRAVAVTYRELHDERSGRMKVQVRSAVPLAEDQQERLRQEFRATFQREPVLELSVDPDLLGGLVVRVEDWVCDASVRTRLETIRNQLIERSSYDIQNRRDHFRT